MRYLRYTQVDAITGVAASKEPMRHGPKTPDGVAFKFALESKYPTAVPTFYGTTDLEVLPEYVTEVTQEDFDTALVNEMQARHDKLLAQLKSSIASIRFHKETGGITLGGVEIKTDRESQSLLANGYTSLKEGLVSQVRWKGADGTWTVFTSSEELKPIAAAVSQHVEGCWSAEEAVSTQLDGMTYKELQQADISALFEAATTQAEIEAVEVTL